MKAGISREGREDLARVVGPGRRFVRGADVVEVLGVGRREAVEKLGAWSRSGWLRRVRRDLYIPVPVDADAPERWSEDPLLVADEVWSPCYFTGWTSANHWSLTEQVFRTTVVKTTGRVRASSVRLLDHDYLVSHVSPEGMEWGIKTEWRSEMRLRMADPARTVVDILDAPRLGGGIRHAAEVLAAYLDDHDTATLVEYGDRLGNRTVFKRLGYIVEAFERDHGDLIAACHERVSAGISRLDPDGPKDGRRVARWGLRINVRVEPEEPS